MIRSDDRFGLWNKMTMLDAVCFYDRYNIYNIISVLYIFYDL